MLRTYFFCAKRTGVFGESVEEANGILKDCPIDPSTPSFVKDLSDWVARECGWPADRVLITALSVLSERPEPRPDGVLRPI